MTINAWDVDKKSKRMMLRDNSTEKTDLISWTFKKGETYTSSTLTDKEIESVQNKRLTHLKPRLVDIYKGTPDEQREALNAINNYCSTLPEYSSTRNWLEERTLQVISIRDNRIKREYQSRLSA